MKMKQFIEMGEKKAGKQIELAKYLNIHASTLGLVKQGKKSLTTALCIKLARYIEVDELEVIAASNLIIEKDEERRKIFESCLKKAGKAAGTTAAAFVISISTHAPISSAEAPLNSGIYKNIHYKQLNRRKRNRRLTDKLYNWIYNVDSFFQKKRYTC